MADSHDKCKIWAHPERTTRSISFFAAHSAIAVIAEKIEKQRHGVAHVYSFVPPSSLHIDKAKIDEALSPLVERAVSYTVAYSFNGQRAKF